MSNKLIDPLAQTFYVDNPKGIFATSVDVYFYDGDRNLPVTVELRPTINGTPSATDIYPFSSVTLEPRSSYSISRCISFDKVYV